MPIYECELWAFGSAGIIRKIHAPANASLEVIYAHGQNDFRPVSMTRSVSCGDIIRWKGRRYMVISAGFKLVANDFIPDTQDILLGYRSL
jgi:hypothetical protein